MSSSRFISFVSLFILAHSQRVFDGITLVDGDEVHIDFKQNNIWNRLQVGTSSNDPVYYKSGVAKRGDRYTWTFKEKGDSMRFKSAEYTFPVQLYIGLQETTQADTYYTLKLLDSTSHRTRCIDWIPKQTSNGTLLECTKSGFGCLHNDMGTSLRSDTECSQTAPTIRIVPRFPCYQASYFGHIIGWYSGLSVDLTQQKWQNMMNTGSDINVTIGSLAMATQNSTGLSYLKGYRADTIEFPYSFPDANYTAIFLTRYQTTNQWRIIECKLSDCAVGHRSGLVGILYMSSAYVTSTTSFADSRTYLISAVQLGHYRANGYDVAITGTPQHTMSDQFCINCRAVQSSDFEIYEAIIINAQITTTNIECIETYLSERYDVALESKSPTKCMSLCDTILCINVLRYPTIFGG